MHPSAVFSVGTWGAESGMDHNTHRSLHDLRAFICISIKIDRHYYTSYLIPEVLNLSFEHQYSTQTATSPYLEVTEMPILLQAYLTPKWPDHHVWLWRISILLVRYGTHCHPQTMPDVGGNNTWFFADVASNRANFWRHSGHSTDIWGNRSPWWALQKLSGQTIIWNSNWTT